MYFRFLSIIILSPLGGCLPPPVSPRGGQVKTDRIPLLRLWTKGIIFPLPYTCLLVLAPLVGSWTHFLIAGPLTLWPPSSVEVGIMNTFNRGYWCPLGGYL